MALRRSTHLPTCAPSELVLLRVGAQNTGGFAYIQGLNQRAQWIEVYHTLLFSPIQASNSNKHALLDRTSLKRSPTMVGPCTQSNGLPQSPLHVGQLDQIKSTTSRFLSDLRKGNGVNFCFHYTNVPSFAPCSHLPLPASPVVANAFRFLFLVRFLLPRCRCSGRRHCHHYYQR